ncbi:MAG: NUDIX hydrolase [Deltaproteobacteria bacterium]|nr:NUDIX hydrolase [Deltaproteobacteria bacterium]NND29266.1 NUDIX hydrolase [Myxococcales bacterium]MBT8463536.1 NUDIX hydrolase [Deltaproteobacteria bacterium]MBT8483422.1 NUDIX hydrolase [Deltaproteobacteria bacterium]NNK08742.1 NUDIX hydrolase [Myxococcales bacterium]
MKSRELLYSGPLFDVARVTFEGQGGSDVVRDVIEHRGAAVILPLLDDGRVVLIRNVRHTVGKVLWELPAGTLEAGEAPSACAAREVEEETGYRAGTLVPLTDFFASPGILNERMHGFLATDLEQSAQSLDHDEEIEVFPIPQWQVRDMIKDGHIEDAKTIALLLYWMHLHSP